MGCSSDGRGWRKCHVSTTPAIDRIFFDQIVLRVVVVVSPPPVSRTTITTMMMILMAIPHQNGVAIVDRG